MTLLQDRLRSTVTTMPRSDGPLLDVRHLVTEFKTHGGWLRAVNDVSFTVPHGKVLGILGESGAGKSALLRTVLGGCQVKCVTFFIPAPAPRTASQTD